MFISTAAPASARIDISKDSDEDQDVGVEKSIADLRERLGELGISYAVEYTSEYFTKVRGGINERNGGHHRNDLSLFLEMNTADADLWRGGTFFLHFQSEGGRGVSEGYVGDFQAISNMDAHDFTQVSELWYRHDFLDNKYWIKIGKQETTEHLAAPHHGGEFLNGSAGFSPTIPIVTYPYTDWAATFGAHPIRWLSANYSVGRGRGTVDDDPCGAMHVLQASLHHRPWGHPGRFTFAWWSATAAFEKFETGEIMNGAQGYYTTWDQVFWKADIEDDEGSHIAAFMQYGWSPADRIEAEYFFGLGLEFAGTIPTRPDDAFGVALFRVNFSPEAGFDLPSETAIECFYKFQYSDWLTVKPDLQYVINPGGNDVDSALVLGARVTVAM